jgi:signal transduction histidine kinase
MRYFMTLSFISRSLVIELNYTLIIALLIFSALVSVVLCVYIYEKSRAGKVMIYFILGVICTILWTILYIFELLAPTKEIHWIVICLEYIPLTLLGFYFMNFAYIYTKHEMMPKKIYYLALTLPVLGYAAVLTNPIHKLVYREISKEVEILGPLCFAIIFMTIGYAGIGALQFVSTEYIKTIARRKQGMYFIIAMLLPSTVHLLSEMKVINFGFRVTLIVIPFSVLLFIVAVLKYQFLDILPIAINDTIDSMNDGVMVINCEGKIIDYNTNFFYKFFGIKNMKHIHTIDKFFIATENNFEEKSEFLPITLSIRGDDPNGVTGKLKLKHRGYKATLFYSAQPIYNFGKKVATLITFFDMTEVYRLYDEVALKNTELIDANYKLNNHTEIVQQLTIESERNSIMDEIHNTLGQSMTELLTMLDLTEFLMAHNKSNILETIENTLVKSRLSLQEVRIAVMNYKKIGGA